MSSPKILITGACGMVGSHLAEYYHAKGISAVGTAHNATINLKEIDQIIDLRPLDIRDDKALAALIKEVQPTIIYHLAAQSYPTVSWEKPRETMDINSNGTINVFEAVIDLRKEIPGYDPMVVVACSSAQYGASLTPENTPVKEATTFLPLHPYGVSKVAQDLLSYQYFQGAKIRCIRARIFNTTGVRKVNDVVSDFTKRAVQIEQGKETIFRCGNLTTKRAIADVRDLINALILLAEKGTPGEAYNISGENVYEIQEVIHLIESVIGQKLNVQIDPLLLRPTDEPVIYGDSSKLKNDTGWQQQIPLSKTIEDMIDYWRKVLS
jgi:GDP-4-dehydro-6-deoxy-D-mannose reductase